MKARMMGAVALGLMVAACGTDPRERTTGGAAAGAATGAGIGALGGPVGALAGAGIGGAAGAVTGATTSPNQVNLGRPLWEDPEVRVPGTGATAGSRSSSGGGMAAHASSSTRQLQQALSQRGFDPGPVDGVYGQRTRQAVMDYQRANNMQPTGTADRQLLSSLGVTGGAVASDTRRGRATSERDRAYMGGGMVGDQQTGGTGTMQGTTGGSSMQGSSTSGSSMGMGGSTGGGGNLSRPEATGNVGAFGNVPQRSNNPMNDPIGGSGGNRPGLNNNSDGGGQGGNSGNSGSGNR